MGVDVRRLGENVIDWCPVVFRIVDGVGVKSGYHGVIDDLGFSSLCGNAMLSHRECTFLFGFQQGKPYLTSLTRRARAIAYGAGTVSSTAASNFLLRFPCRKRTRLSWLLRPSW